MRMKKLSPRYVVFGLGIVCLLFLAPSARAALPSWLASSTDFILFGNILSTSGGNATSTYSTSTDFKMYGAAGETGTGTSTSADFGISSGFLRNIAHETGPIYEQVHYQWRNDDGSESGATSATGGSQDSALSSIQSGTLKRLRIEVANHGGTVAGYNPQSLGLQFGALSSTCGAITTWTNVGMASSTTWNIATSSNLTNGANTTNIAISTGGVSATNNLFLTPNGGVVNGSNTTTAAVSLPSNAYIELEYALVASSSAVSGTTYCFRAENASSTSYYKYTAYPQATVSSSGGSLTFITDSGSETLPALAPGTSTATSSVFSINTTNASGFNVTVIRSNSTSTLMLSGSSVTGIPDKASWIPGVNCSTVGNAAASTTLPQTLQFRIKQTGSDSGNYCSAWWGGNDTSSALFAGFPTTTQQIINRSTASSPTTTAIVNYSVNVPATQQTGVYTGTVTYTATANP